MLEALLSSIFSSFFSLAQTYDWGPVAEWMPILLTGVRLTLWLSVAGILGGLPFGIIFALGRLTEFLPIYVLATAYVEAIRGTPLLVQILIAFFVLPVLGIQLSAINAGLAAIIVNTSAYQAEIIRAGIESIPSGQLEAARGLGMTYPQAMRHVILPQAFRLIIPPMTNEFIILIKDTSLVSVIGVVELTGATQFAISRTFRVLEFWLTAAALYLVIVYSLSVALRYMERRLRIPGLGMGDRAA